MTYKIVVTTDDNNPTEYPNTWIVCIYPELPRRIDFDADSRDFALQKAQEGLQSLADKLLELSDNIEKERKVATNV